MSRRKIFDIIPPKEKTIKRSLESNLPEPQKSFSKSRRFLFVFVLVLTMIGTSVFFSYTFVKPKAEIEIWLKTKIKNFKTQLTITNSIEKPDFGAFLIPGKIIEAGTNISQEFLSVGSHLKKEKARGIIRVYNAYSTHPQVLIATTRFVSADGKLFRTPKRVVIPGGRYEKGKLIPGFIDIEVVADQPGEEYNIGPTTFSIPGLAGTAKYTAFYGKSFQPMKGGKIVKESMIFKKEDLENFVKAYLKKQISEKEEIDQENINIKYRLEDQDFDEGKILFELEISAKIFKKIDLEDIKEKFFDKTPQEIKEIFISTPGILGGEIKLTPFWIKKVPKDPRRVEIEIKIE